MSFSKIESEGVSQFKNYFSNDKVYEIIKPILPLFDRKMKSYVYFNMGFLTLGALEFILLVTFFTFLVQSSILAFSLALVFLTFFSYFILRLYLQTKKPEQFKSLLANYTVACKSLVNYNENSPDYHIALANSYCRLADALHNLEYNLYSLPEWLSSLKPWMKKFSYWWHWEDVFKVKELLLQMAVEENIKLVKCEPTSLQAHVALANAYVMLSGLYVDPRKIEGFEEDHWKPFDQFEEILEKKFRATAERAIEEFKILNHYAPDDPWVHSQLAFSYHDLQMPQEEIREYEIIMKLTPNDKDTLFKLGVLYFQQGLNAQGLRIYEELKRSNYKKCEALIKYYGTFDAYNFLDF
jgi:hypothetical protein